MSLLDSLLLDSQKLDVWIAVRTDGVKGSGTEADPYDATPTPATGLSVTSLTNAGREATATTAVNHGYLDGDAVTIAGAAQFNGTFPIYGKTNNTFKYYMNAAPGGSAAGAGCSPDE